MRFIFTVLVLMSSLLANAQAVLDSLYNAGFITKKEMSRLARRDDAEELDSNMLQALIWVNMVFYKSNPSKADLTIYAGKLLQAKLISDSTRNKLEKDIASNRFMDQIQLLASASRLTRNEKFLMPESFNLFAETLLKKQMISIYGYVLLTQEQARGFQPDHEGTAEPYLAIPEQNFSNALSSQNIAAAIKVYDSLGLFNHLTQKEKDSCINELRSYSFVYYSELLAGFRDLVFEIHFDSWMKADQYEDITNQIARISRGRFNPTKIIDNFAPGSAGSFLYGFTLNGKKYTRRLEQMDESLDPAFFQLIEKAMKEQDAEGAFHQLYPTYGLKIIYLSNSQYQALNELGLIELDGSPIPPL